MTGFLIVRFYKADFWLYFLVIYFGITFVILTYGYHLSKVNTICILSLYYFKC